MAMSILFSCPLCQAGMKEEDGRLVCNHDHNHIISIDKELLRYNQGEYDYDWLKMRMKVRLGKLTHRR